MVEKNVEEIMLHILPLVEELLQNVCGDVSVEENDNPDTKFYEYTALMEIWGNVTGQIYMSFSKEALEQISEKLFGMNLKEMGDDEFYFEGAKELINILTGNCKTELKSSGFDFEASLPDSIVTEAANENLSFSNHVTKAFTSESLKMTINIAYY